MNFQQTNLPAVVDSELPVTVLPAADDDRSSLDLSMTQIVDNLRAHLKGSIISLGVLVLISGVIIKILPHSYVATATLIVDLGDRNPLAAPNFRDGGDYAFIPTQIDLIQSAAVLQPVIDRLHLMSSPEWERGYSGNPAGLREAILTELTKSLNVYQGGGSDLLYIVASAKYPDEAAAIANTIANQYLQLNQQRIGQPAKQREELYTKELEQLREQTIQAQDQVTAFRQKHRMVDLAPGDGDEAEAALKDLQQKLLAAQNQERTIEAQMQAQPGGMIPPTRPGAGDLAAKLAAEESQLANASETLGPRHPEVLALESQIAATKRSITSGLSSQLADAHKLVAQYSAAVQSQQEKVLTRRSLQDQGSKLLLELESAKATYKHALDGYSQVQFASSNASNNVSLLTGAVPPVKAVKPNKKEYFLVSCVLSFSLAFGVPFVYELLLNRRLRCRDDFERSFGIRVLAEFDPIPSEGSQA